jgi:transcriptional regulator with XRE-family HTH domain
MSENKHENINQLVVYRRRMGFSQKQVARLLGHSNAVKLSMYEKGLSNPSFHTALSLEIIYRVPVAFLFPALYEELRNHIRGLEASLPGPGESLRLSEDK